MQLSRRGVTLALLVLLSILAMVGTASAQRPPEQRPPISAAPAFAPPPPYEPPAPDRAPAKGTSNVDASIGSEVAGYADSDHVFVFTPSIAGAASDPTAGWSVTGDYLVDVVSAASVDIVSTASRRWKEVRQAGSLGAAYKPGTFGGAANASISYEPDYTSLGVGGNISQDLFDKNFTWLLGYNYGHDVAGRTGTPFSVFSHEIDRHGFKLGSTFVLGRATIASFVGDLMLDRGDQSKPYRFIPLFTPGQTLAPGASAADVSRLRVSERPLEQLPLARERYAISGRFAHRFKAATGRLDERLYIDSWGMKATSTDVRYLVDAGRVELGPHLRFHAQSPVDFFRRQYFMGPGFTYPALRTGDRELGPLVNVTAGGSLSIGIGSRVEPRAVRLGFDLNGIWTRYLDDLYITQRLSVVGGLSLEADL